MTSRGLVVHWSGSFAWTRERGSASMAISKGESFIMASHEPLIIALA